MKQFNSLSTDINYELIKKMHTQFAKHLRCIIAEGVQLDPHRSGSVYCQTETLTTFGMAIIPPSFAYPATALVYVHGKKPIPPSNKSAI